MRAFFYLYGVGSLSGNSDFLFFFVCFSCSCWILVCGVGEECFGEEGMGGYGACH